MENKDENNSDELIVVCRCGSVIPSDQIEVRNRCNEEGEDYGEVSAECNVCHNDYETSQWGEWDNKEEAVKHLMEYISNKNG